MRGKFRRSLDEKLVDMEQSYQCLKFGEIREKHKVQLWHLRIRQPAQTTLREKFWKKKLKVDADYEKNKKLLTT
jgi:ubiquitin-protein ligase